MDAGLQGEAKERIERRRMQNRIAQRKFRQKREQKQAEAAVVGRQNDIQASHPLNNLSRFDSHNESDAIDPGLLFPAIAPAIPPAEQHEHNASSSMGDLGMEQMTGLPSNLVDSGTDLLFALPSPRRTEPSPTADTSDVPEPPPARSSAQLSPFDIRSVLVSPPPSTAPSDDGWIGSIHLAAQAGHVSILRVLLDQGIDPDEPDSDGKTALVHATIENHLPAVTVLLDNSARIGAADRDGRSAIHWATLYRREEVLEVLLKYWGERGGPKEVEIDAYDDAGFTALHMAVHNGFEAGVLMLLRCGANVRFKARKCPYSGTVIPYSFRDIDIDTFDVYQDT